MWSAADDPALFTADLERNINRLPTKGVAAVTPWTGSYWPTYQDSINYRWDGARSDSPARKYELAFGGHGVERAVSAHFGIDSIRGGSCGDDGDCNRDLSEVCSMHPGASSGTCIASWFGVCHAWAPAAILLPEPKHGVVLHGVEFKVSDIKALATIAYTSTRSKFVSLRCERGTPGNPIGYDSYGRPSDPEDGGNEGACRDTNPGTYHLLLANYLGLKGQSFVEDATQNYQVWNFPLRDYAINELTEISSRQANELLGVAGGTARAPLQAAEVKRGAWVSLGAYRVTPGTAYEVDATLSTALARTDVYVGFNRQPDESSYACHAVASGKSRTCSGTVPEGATAMYVAAKGGKLVNATVSGTVSLASGTPDAYVFNRDAVRFAKVHATVQYIVESKPEADGNQSRAIDKYTATKGYDYVLELDRGANVIGGEWLGKSRDNHPDFVWLPLGPGASSVAGGAIKYDDVKRLLDLSVDAPATPATPATPPTAPTTAPTVPPAPTPGPVDAADAGTTTAPTEGTSLDASAPPTTGIPQDAGVGGDAGH